MKKIYSITIIFLLALTSCGQEHSKKNNMKITKNKFTNNLIHETSPYLLQHAHNPVNWYPWGEEALNKAKKENKLIIISIGYAACHWCHVMENESFENEEVAKFMNDNFIAIKVDREERPDIDQVYMNAVQLITGRGGWPLNCIALPDGRPIYGGTYFRSEQWVNMLKQVLSFVEQTPEKAEIQAKQLTQGVKANEIVVENTQDSGFTTSELNNIFSSWKNGIDYEEGGYLGSPKFPLPIGYQFLLHYYYITKNEDALLATTLTLNKMANGGIYDQIGGGFARYSTDAYWKVPHFEKMLYDNAQLISLYSSAYQQNKNPKYKTIVTETLDFIQRELTSPEGGFYSSLDADSEGIEGKFYVWSENELQKILRNKADLIINYYNVTEAGNWENDINILFKYDNDNKIKNKYKITQEELDSNVKEAKLILLKQRENRIRPRLDDKILTSWNALMLKGYVDAYRVFNDKKYLDIAIKNANFINSKIIDNNNKLFRNYKNGKASINGFLDDYAFTIQAFIALYQATFNEKWLKKAELLTEYAIAHFYDKKSSLFYYTSDIDPELIARKMEISDNVIPSSNSEMAKNLFILGHYFFNDEYIQKAKQMLTNVKQNTFKSGAYYANWDILAAWIARPPHEIAIVGKDYEAIRIEFNKYYLPNVFLSGGKNEGSIPSLKNRLVKGETTIYVCQDRICKMPVYKVEEALLQINK